MLITYKITVKDKYFVNKVVLSDLQ